MRRKTITGLAALLALLVFATAASADQWYIENAGNRSANTHRLKPGTVEEQSVEGKWLLRLKAPGPKQPLLKEQCFDSRTDLLSNSETDAFDEVISMTLVCPEGVTATTFLPWHGTLEGAGEPFTEPMTNMGIEVTTPSRSWGLFTGSEIAFYGDGDPKSAVRDDIDDIFKINAKSGELFSAEGATLELGVQDRYGIKGVNRANGERDGEPEEAHGGGEGPGE